MLDIALSTCTVFIDVAYSRRGVSRNQPKHYAKYRGLDPRVLLFLLQSLRVQSVDEFISVLPYPA